VLVLAGERLNTVVRDNFLSAIVPAKLYSNPGSLPLLVETVRSGRLSRSKPVNLEVQ
jgi:hypothetical protein